MNVKQAIVLAGGLGTRLQGVLPGMPKCMAPVQGAPFLSHVLNYLISQQIKTVILSVGYRKEQIINYFGNSFQSLSILYAIENEPLGTGGAIKLAFDHSAEEKAFVMNGDTFFLPDLSSMEQWHTMSSADITIAVKHMPETGRYGLVETDHNGRITAFREKDPRSGSGWINGGIYLINRNIFKNIRDQKFSIENDLFKVSCSTLHMQSFRTDASFLDMGIPEDYDRAQTFLPAWRGI
ncbi:MAG: nucleotidyltransferase family protein [Bacteroidota bacterium]